MNGRRLALVLATSLSLIGASSAQAAITIAGPHGSTPPKLWTFEGHDLVTGLQVIGDPGPEPAPDLTVDPGSGLTITVTEEAHTEITASVGGTPLALTATTPGTYTATLPADLPLPSGFSVQLRNQTAQVNNRTLVGVRLVAPVPPAPPAPPVVTDPAPKADQPPSVTALKLKGRRLSATVVCPSGCVGYLTLRTKSIRIARFTVARNGTYTATVSASALRHLKRHKTKELRSLLTTRGRAPIATTVQLAR